MTAWAVFGRMRGWPVLCRTRLGLLAICTRSRAWIRCTEDSDLLIPTVIEILHWVQQAFQIYMTCVCDCVGVQETCLPQSVHTH